jgi:hypothetical protein
MLGNVQETRFYARISVLGLQVMRSAYSREAAHYHMMKHRSTLYLPTLFVTNFLLA